MGSRLRHGARLATVVALALTPALGSSAAFPTLVSAAASTSGPSLRADGAAVPVDLVHQEVRLTPVAPPQQIEPQTTLVWKADSKRKVRVAGPRGSRVWTASALASHDLPQAALTAYQNAAAAMATLDPSCQLPWTLLAGIGRVESDHGRYGGSVLSSDGVSRPQIIGVALNGRGPVAAIHDTDDGKLDGDKVWDRAVGPMQFIPSTWSYAGRDGDGDGKQNPHDIDDTALAAGAYLCSGSGSMLDDASAKAAIFRYNPSDYYVALVQAFERGYRTGVFVMPSPPPPAREPGDRPRAKKHRDADVRSLDSDKPRPKSPSARPTPENEPKPAPKPSPKPSPSPSPKPSPSPSPPETGPLSGSLNPCGGDWCLGTLVLDLGPGTQLGAVAAHDYDGDGEVLTNAEELTGLVGRTVALTVGTGTSPAVVYAIAGQDYRFADGGFARPASS